MLLLCVCVELFFGFVLGYCQGMLLCGEIEVCVLGCLVELIVYVVQVIGDCFGVGVIDMLMQVYVVIVGC